MQQRNVYIDSFVDTLCRQRYDVAGNDVAAQKLQELRESKVLLPGQLYELMQFDHMVRSFEHLAMEEDVDLEDAKNVEKAKQYEDFVQKSDIHPANKAALYNTLLGLIDMNGGGNKWYMEVLRRKADILPPGADTELNLTAKQAFFHRPKKAGHDPVYLAAMYRLYSKMSDKMRFTFLNELGLVADKSGKRLRAASGLTPKQRDDRLGIIEAIVSEPLDVKERIALLEEGIELASNNLQPRNKNFAIKSKFYNQLQNDYYAIGDARQGNHYGSKSRTFDECATRAIVIGSEKGDKWR